MHSEHKGAILLVTRDGRLVRTGATICHHHTLAHCRGAVLFPTVPR